MFLIIHHTERLLPKSGIFFRLQAYERVGISLNEVYLRVGYLRQLKGMESSKLGIESGTITQ